MNRGTFRGSPASIGDYTYQPNSGSWGGNRGRFQVDELRLFGVADGQSNWLAAGAARVINVAAGRNGPSALYAPGDTGMVVNAVSGTILCNGVGFPFQSVYNTSGRLRFTANSSAGFAGYEMNTVVDNLAGSAISLPNLVGATTTAFYVANVSACSITQFATTGAFDVQSFPIMGTTGAGTLSATSYTNFLANSGIQTGVTVTTRRGFYFLDTNQQGSNLAPLLMASGNGAVTNNVGLDVPGISFGSNNIGVRLMSSAATYTAAQGSPVSLQTPILINGTNPSTGVTQTLNFANASWGSLINIMGTFALSQSAAALSMGAGFIYQPVIKNTNGVVANFGVAIAISSAPTLTADGASISASTQIGFNAQVTTSVLNAGTLSGLNFRAYNVGAGGIGASTTVSQFTGLFLNDVSNSGTVSLYVGIEIPALSASTASIGIRNASTTVYTPSGNQTLAAGTTISPNAAAIAVIQTSGAGITLTATPTITAGQNGQILIITNVSTVASSAFTFQSVSSLAGSGLSLGATTRVVGIKGSLTLQYNSALSRWVEIGFNGGTFG
jgi:hypothetical protein